MKNVTLVVSLLYPLVATIVMTISPEAPVIQQMIWNSKHWKFDSIRLSSIMMSAIRIWKPKWWSGSMNFKILSWRKSLKLIIPSWSPQTLLDSKRPSNKSEDNRKSSSIKSTVSRPSQGKEIMLNLWWLKTLRTSKKWLSYSWSWWDWAIQFKKWMIRSAHQPEGTKAEFRT